MTNIFDSHVHSDNSSDAHHSVMFLCERAVEERLTGICITDHCELRDYEQDNYALRIGQSFFEASKAKRVFNGRLNVAAGVELSDVLYDEALTARVLSEHAFDMVLVSQHTAQDGSDIYYEDFKTWDPERLDAYLTFYFGYLLRVARWDGLDVLAHMTYPVRYISGRDKVPVDLRRYDGLIDEILRTLAQNGKAIEINTSGLWQALGDTMPSYAYIKRFRELGGEFVTIGSDAHSADALGRGVRSGMQMLVDAGFSSYTVYKERQPLQFNLIK